MVGQSLTRPYSGWFSVRGVASLWISSPYTTKDLLDGGVGRASRCSRNCCSCDGDPAFAVMTYIQCDLPARICTSTSTAGQWFVIWRRAIAHALSSCEARVINECIREKGCDCDRLLCSYCELPSDRYERENKQRVSFGLGAGTLAFGNRASTGSHGVLGHTHWTG